MKSISEISNSITFPEPGTALALAPRLSPLSTDEIDKIEARLNEYGMVSEKTSYGSVPVYDKDGNCYKHEFLPIGTRRAYICPEKAPQRLKEAILRPATQKAIVAHLTRLGVHLRDTRGPESLAVAAVEISRELEGVSEWAVIDVYRELWTREGAVFYPTSSEVRARILEKDAQIKAVFGDKPETRLLENCERPLENPQPKLENHGYLWETMTDDERKTLIQTVKGKDPRIQSAIKTAYSVPASIDFEGYENA